VSTLGEKSFSKEDAAKETDTSTSKVSEAWHDARERAQRDGELPERAAHKESKQKK